MNKMFGFHIRGLKLRKGSESYDMSGTLMHGKTPVATFVNEGLGGQTDFTPIAPKEVFLALAKHAADQYAKIGHDSTIGTATAGGSATFDHLVNDIVYLDGVLKDAKRYAKKCGIEKAYASICTFRNNNFGGAQCFSCVLSAKPFGKGHFRGYGGGDVYFLGAFASNEPIEVVGGEVA